MITCTLPNLVKVREMPIYQPGKECLFKLGSFTSDNEESQFLPLLWVKHLTVEGITAKARAGSRDGRDGCMYSLVP